MRVLHVLGEPVAYPVVRAHAVLSGENHSLLPVAAVDDVVADLFARLPLAAAPTLPFGGAPSLARFQRIAQSLTAYDLVLTYGYAAIDALLARRMGGKAVPPIIHHEVRRDEADDARRRIERRLVRRLALPAAASLVVGSKAIAEVAHGEWRRASLVLPPAALAEPAPKPTASVKRLRGEFVVGASLIGSSEVELRTAVARTPNARLLLFGGQGGASPDHVRPAQEAEAFGVLDLWLVAREPDEERLARALAGGLPIAASRPLEGLSEDNEALLAAIALPDLVLRFAGRGEERRRLGNANREAVRLRDERQLRAQLAVLIEQALATRR